MNFTLRGLIAGGVLALAALAVEAADTPAPAVAAPDKAPAAAAPASAPAATSAACGCDGSAGRVLGGRLGGRFGNRFNGSRSDQFAETLIGANERLANLFNRLAGPPIDAQPHGHHGFHKGGPGTQPGTVVFPQHPFVRSPRDFFMTEQP